MPVLRFKSFAELKKHISPDVVIVGEPPPTPINQRLQKASSPRTILEDKFLANWQYLGGQPLVREHRFHPTRKWRLDFAIPDAQIGFEIQGGLYQAESGHRSMAGVKRDMEKHNAAQELGWSVYYLTSQDVQSVPYLEGLIANVKWRIESGGVVP
jgi:hypothetical protein